MAYDIYGRVKNGLKRIAVPAGSSLPQGANPEDYRKLGTMNHVWESLEAEIEKRGFGTYEVTIKITEPS